MTELGHLAKISGAGGGSDPDLRGMVLVVATDRHDLARTWDRGEERGVGERAALARDPVRIRGPPERVERVRAAIEQRRASSRARPGTSVVGRRATAIRPRRRVHHGRRRSGRRSGASAAQRSVSDPWRRIERYARSDAVNRPAEGRMSVEPFQHIPLGRTGLTVTRLGLGGASIGGLYRPGGGRRRDRARRPRLVDRRPLVRCRAALRLRQRRAPDGRRPRRPAPRRVRPLDEGRRAWSARSTRSRPAPTSTDSPTGHATTRTTPMSTGGPWSSTTAPTASAGRSRRASSGWACRASTSCTSTIRTSTGRRPFARPTRHSNACEPRAPSGRSAPG